ncbi:MAG: hypothetical protein HFG02_00750 [Oscillibacter sp.]|nr:hypothetical protein [Oscillibacter sp.]
MAKYERRFTGNFHTVLSLLHNGILRGSATASYEDGSDYTSGDIRCAVRVYERYSVSGGNRLSLTLVLIGHGDDLFLSAVTAGGSQGAFFKINTWSEEFFLNQIRELAGRL